MSWVGLPKLAPYQLGDTSIEIIVILHKTAYNNTGDDMSVFNRIYAVVCKIPKGKVATYGQVALLAGNPRWARVVGYALHNNPSPQIIPCHRVVNREGRVAEAFVFGGGEVQRRLLEEEGVIFGPDGRIDLTEFGIKLP